MTDESPVTRREIALITEAVNERMKVMEQRLTVRMLVTVLGANALAAFAGSPAVAAVLAGITVVGVGALKFASFLT